jgi:hypothetical protein
MWDVLGLRDMWRDNEQLRKMHESFEVLQKPEKKRHLMDIVSTSEQTNDRI